MKLRFLPITIFLILLFSSVSFCWSMNDEYEAEIEEKERLVKVHADDPHAYFDLAITYAYTNKIEDGLNMLKKAEKLDKDFSKKALDIYSKKAALFPDEWKVRFRYAFALYFNKKRDEAISEFENIVKDHPDNVFAYAYIAIIYGEKEDVKKAIKWSKKAIKVDSNVAAIHLLLAAAYYKNGHALQGFQETMEALRLRALGF